MNHCLHLTDLTSAICQCTEESVHRRKDNCHDITMCSYQIIAELFTQWLISKVLYRQSSHTNFLSFLVVNLYQYKTLTLELHWIAVVM